MWYLVQQNQGDSSILEFDISKVHEIIEMNKKGKKPEDFIKFRNTQENDKGPDYKNVVGQDDLKRFDKVFKKKKRKNSKKRKNPHNKARKNQ